MVAFLLTQLIAFGVHAPIVAAFNYAVRLMEFPQGVFGISLATYLLPTLSGLAADKQYDQFRITLRQGLGYLLFVNLLAAVLLLVLAQPIIRLLYERGQFGPGSTGNVAMALACLAPGLIAYSSVNILARAFYALGDTKTPMQISVFCLVVNLLFAILLIQPFRAAGLGLANTATSFLNLGLLWYGLGRKLGRLELGDLRATILTMIPAACLAGMTAWALSYWWEAQLGHDHLLLKIGAVFGPMLLASALYLGIGLWTGIPAARDLFNLLRRKQPGV